jgi:hypothetical protein
MSDENDGQYASPPCYLHELDPEFRETEKPEARKKKRPLPPPKAETDDS